MNITNITLRNLIREILSEASQLEKKHLIGGVTGNHVVQKAVAQNKLDTFEIIKNVKNAPLLDTKQDPKAALEKKEFELVNISKGTIVTLTTLNKEDVLMVGRSPSILVKIKNNNKFAVVPISSVGHNMGESSKQGTLSRKLLGAAVEHAVAGGLSGDTIGSIIKKALGDTRYSLKSASKNDLEVFKKIIKLATNIVKPWKNKIGIVSASVDAGPTAKVDVEAKNKTGESIAIHVKYNDAARLFGLQQKTKKGTSEGAESTRIFRSVREKYVQAHLVSQTLYKKLNKNATKKQLAIIKRKGGTNDGTVEPMLYPTQMITRHEDPSEIVTMIQDPNNLFMNQLIEAGYTDTLSQEIKNSLSPEGMSTYYFKFKGGKEGLKLDVQAFNVGGIKFVVIPTGDGTVSNAFTINAVTENGDTIENVLKIELPSIRRGHPPQIKTAKNYSKLVQLNK
jgi:hypothetical protein